MKHISVTAGILRKKNKILIAQRKEGDKLGGRWEFPGGKIRPGEGPEDCLTRELEEELNIKAEVGNLFLKNEHRYSDFSITLLTYMIKSYSGPMKARDHARILWVSPPEMLKFNFAEADIPVVRKLQGGGNV